MSKCKNGLMTRSYPHCSAFLVRYQKLNFNFNGFTQLNSTKIEKKLSFQKSVEFRWQICYMRALSSYTIGYNACNLS